MRRKTVSSYSGTRIGIYAGSFDPIHTGHIAFALQALDEAKLDMVFFMPERVPRHKPGVTHYAHRVAMLRRVVRPHQGLDVLEMEDVAFSVVRTTPRLRKRFSGAQLVLLMGNDVVTHLNAWPQVGRLLKNAELCIGLRNGADRDMLRHQLAALPIAPKAIYTLDSFYPDIASSKLRRALRRGTSEQGILQTVRRYAKEAWLYI